jgi:hypothetical protein
MKGSDPMNTDTPEHRRLIGELMAQDYATLTENPEGRFLFSEMIADILHEAVGIGQEAANVLQRALRIYGREGGVVDIGGTAREPHRIETPAAETPAVDAPRVQRPRPPEPDAGAVECNWEEPPHAQPAVPHWEEPPDLSTVKRGRFARFEQEMRDNPNRWLVLATDASGSYASGLRKQYGEDFEFEHKRMRRSDKRSYRVWSRYIGRPNLKCHKEEAG